MRMRGGPGGRWRMGGPLMALIGLIGGMQFMRGMRGMPMANMMRGGFLRRWLLPIPFIFFGMLCCMGYFLARAFDTGDFRCLVLPFCCVGSVIAIVGLFGVLAFMFYEEVIDDDDDDEEKAINTIDGDTL